MSFKRGVVSVTMGIGLAFLVLSAGAQSGEKYKIRLTPVPALTSRGAGITIPRAAVAGAEGSGTAILSGKKLSVNGSFDKLASPATEAHLFLGIAKGARSHGSAPIFDLTLMKAADGKSGSFNGSFDLTNEQVDALKIGKIYLQVHSEGSPTGHLLGWLLK